MQHTLLSIHEARTHLWSQRQLPAEGHDSGQGGARADLPGAPLPADTGQAQTGNGAPRRLQAQDVFANPQIALPRYCWERPVGGARFALPPLPARIGAAPCAKDRHKSNPDHLPWRYGSGFIEPLYWFWASLEWVDQVQVGDEVINTTSYCELAVAFQLLTGLVPDADTTAAGASMQQRGHFFTAASKRLAAILGSQLCPGANHPQPDVLPQLRFQHSPGVEGRFSLPSDYWQHYCAVWVRAHLEVPSTVGAQRQLKWTPNFDRIGFEAARRWVRARHLAAALAQVPTPVRAAGSTTGQPCVCQPAPVPPGRRLRGKQGGAAVGVVAPAAPIPKVRAAVKQPRLTDDDLTEAENAQIQGLSGVRKNQMLKLLRHNRDAVDRGKHFVIVGHEADTIGQLKCRDCAMQGRWAEWPYFAVRSNCKRRSDGASSSSSASRACSSRAR